MSETTSTPQPDDDEGTFVGGSFGDETTEAAGRQVEIDVTDVFAVGSVEEATDVEGVEKDTTDVEGTGTDVAPGERNEPV